MRFKIFVQTNTFKITFNYDGDLTTPPSVLDHKLVRNFIRHIASETRYWGVERYLDADLDIVEMCAETQSVTLNNGRLCLHTNPTLVLV